MEIQITYPSNTEGHVIDLKKGRAQFSLTEEERNFLMALFSVTSFSEQNKPSVKNANQQFGVQQLAADIDFPG